MLVDIFHWHLCLIDATDMESLIRFVFRYPKWKQERGAGSTTNGLFADQVDW